MTRRICVASALLDDPMLRIRYPSAHLLIKKQSAGLFFLTFAALLGFKSRPLKKENPNRT